jgi:hypothetical protein
MISARAARRCRAPCFLAGSRPIRRSSSSESSETAAGEKIAGRGARICLSMTCLQTLSTNVLSAT